jgi:hypothetical protein
MEEALSVGVESMPLHEEIKSSQGKGQPHLERGPGPRRNFLQRADATQQREYGLDQHPRILQAPITQFELHWISLFGMESGIPQDAHFLFESLNQRVKGTLRRIRSGTIPADHQT